MRLKLILKTIVFVVILSGVGFLSYQFGITVGEGNILKIPPANISNSDPLTDFAIFWEAWRKLEITYLEKEKIDYTAMIYGAIKGMVDSVGDPYTVFFTPQKAEEFAEELSGKYEGVGMVVGIKNDQLTVVSPFKGTPAYEAGLLPGDLIIKVEDSYTSDITIEDAVSLIKGPEGTFVRLLIQRESFPEPKEFTIERRVITIPTLELEIIDDEIAVIKLNQFNRIISSELAKAAIEILNSNAKKIIIDLRNNPGGYLDEAIKVASWFLHEGEIVTWQKTIESEKPFGTEGPGTFATYPMVVLINQGSASGSEILAGALRDVRGIQLIGEKSFGKGSVQEQLSLSDGSSLKVTIAKWLTPNKISIDDEGLAPDVEVILSDGGDNQLEKAIEILKELK